MAIGFFRRLFGKRTRETLDEHQDGPGDGSGDDNDAAPGDGSDDQSDDDAAPEAAGEAPHGPGQAAGEARYCRVRFEAFPIGDGEEVLRARAGAAIRASLHDGDLLRRCDRFMTLDEHARAVCAELDGGEAMHAEVMGTLAAFARAGLLHRQDALLAQARAAAHAADPRSAPPPLTRLVLTTRNRVDLACRAVQTYAASAHAAGPANDRDRGHGRDHGHAHGRPIEIAIFDDAADDSARGPLYHGLAPIADAAGDALALGYAGPDQRRAFAARLVEVAGADLREAIDFALFATGDSDWHPGANRNAALLHAAGAMLVCADDDTRCPLARMPGADLRPGLRLGAQADPTILWLHANAADALAAADAVERDVLAAHAALLGRSIDDCLRPLADGDVDLDDVSPALLDRLAAGHGRVLLTTTGVIGDLGVRDPHAYLLLEGASRQRLMEAYPRLRLARHGIRGVTRTTVSPPPDPAGAFAAPGLSPCLGPCIGIDHRELLPPFFPFDRGPEAVFAAALRVCRDDAHVGHLPWLVQHQPGARPAFTRADLFAPTEGISSALHALLVLGTHAPAPALRDPAHRMIALGRHLQMIGGLRPGDYRDFIREHHMQVVGEHLAALQEAQARYADEAGADTWADDVAESIDRWRDLVTGADWGAPRDLMAAGLSPGEAWAAAQGAIRRHGLLLEAWPRIVDAARALADAGEPMTVSLDEVEP